MTTTKEPPISQSDLAQFTGTETWWRHWFRKDITYTDGVKFVAEKCGAYWLLDEIVFGQTHSTVSAEEFQVWKLRVKDNTATLTVEDGDYNVVFRKEIPFTDFPLPEIDLWFTDNVILLQSEY